VCRTAGFVSQLDVLRSFRSESIRISHAGPATDNAFDPLPSGQRIKYARSPRFVLRANSVRNCDAAVWDCTR
jgi:hypothetical protein